MAEVSITINGRAYDIGCDTGQEGRIVDLAHYIDEKVQQIARTGNTFNDAHLMVLASLVLADELFETHERLASTGGKPAVSRTPAVPPPVPAVSKEDEQAVVRALSELAKRIQTIAERVQKVA